MITAQFSRHYSNSISPLMFNRDTTSEVPQVPVKHELVVVKPGGHAQVQPLHLSGLVALTGQSLRSAGHYAWRWTTDAGFPVVGQHLKMTTWIYKELFIRPTSWFINTGISVPDYLGQHWLCFLLQFYWVIHFPSSFYVPSTNCIFIIKSTAHINDYWHAITGS